MKLGFVSELAEWNLVPLGMQGIGVAVGGSIGYVC